jgi:hypothetical protein
MQQRHRHHCRPLSEATQQHAQAASDKDPLTRILARGRVCACLQVYAQNAIRKKSEALNYLRLASRLDAVSSRLDTQVKMNQVRRGGCRRTVAMRPRARGHSAEGEARFARGSVPACHILLLRAPQTQVAPEQPNRPQRLRQLPAAAWQSI